MADPRPCPRSPRGAGTCGRVRVRRGDVMGLTINIYYTGTEGSARAFAQEMVSSGIVAEIRAKEGNLRYAYFFPMDDPETVLLIDQWSSQAALDAHHGSVTMQRIMALRDKYDLHMKVERFCSDVSDAGADREYIRE